VSRTAGSQRRAAARGPRERRASASRAALRWVLAGGVAVAVALAGAPSGAAVAAPAPRPHWSAGELAAYARGVERAWARLTSPDGRVRDQLEPDYGDFNYGTLMLAQAQLRGAARRGRRGDSEPVAAAVAQILGTTARPAVSDPFHLLAATTLLRDGRQRRLPRAAWARIARPLRRWIGTIMPFRGHSFASRTGYDNWRLVFAAAGAELPDAVVRGAPGSVVGDLRRLRRQVRWIVSRLMPRHAGPRLRTRGTAVRLDRRARSLSDPPWQPHAYHLFSTLLLERAYRARPRAFGRAARRVRAEAGRYALALMAPDGQLTHVGRSAEQSWVLAAAADLGALRASAGGRGARRWRAFAERAVDRLVREHRLLPDGTIPVVPGLLSAWDPEIMDGYASMTQYDGLTLFLLEDAIDHWPRRVRRLGPLPTDAVGALAADVRPRGSGLVWGRASGTWWALSGRRSQNDGRYQQGLIAVKAHDGRRWRELLATRPQRDPVGSGWLLQTPRGQARLVLDRVAGDGRRARLRGWWRIDGRPYRRARWELRAGGGAVAVATEPLRAGESLTGAVWVRPGTVVEAPGGSIVPLACTVTASGPACPQTFAFAAGGPRPRVALAAGSATALGPAAAAAG